MDNQNEKPQATTESASIAADDKFRDLLECWRAAITIQGASAAMRAIIRHIDSRAQAPSQDAHPAQQRADGDERAQAADNLSATSLDLLRKGLRDWETPENRYAAQRVLDAIEARAAQRADSALPVVAKSIDTPKFRDLLGDMLDAYRKELQGGPMEAYEKARPKFIAYIDAVLQQAASQPAAAAQGEDAKNAALRDWANAERIAAVPIVEDAIRGFSEDPTGNNGVCVVLAVLDAAMQANKQEKA